jgi:hypothetical protein
MNPLVTALIPILLILLVTPLAQAKSESSLLKQIIAQQKLLLNATHNTTAQLQISNIFLQNAMVENHNNNARLLQALGPIQSSYTYGKSILK